MTGGSPSRRRRAWALTCAAGGAVLVLAVVVHLGLTGPLDDLVRQWARPDDVWGSPQIQADVIVEGLRPTSAVLLTGGLIAAISLARRSPRPLLVAAATVLVMVAVTVGLKLLLHRPDPHGALSDHGGSFPSGHTVTVVVCTGLVTMLLTPARHQWWWITTALLVGTVMAVALLLQAAHWATDVVGGVLAGVTILAAVAGVRADLWCRGGPPTTLAGRTTRAISSR
jgi:membrane-associated phospholipid phosphatase